MMKRARRVTSIALALAAVGASAMSATAVTAKSVGTTATGAGGSAVADFIAAKGTTFIANQVALDEFKGWIITRAGIDASGYVESIDDPATKSVTIRWYGPASALQREIVAQAAQRGIKVTIQAWKYSLPQLNAAVAAVWKSAAAGAWPGFKVTSVVAISDATGGVLARGEYTTSSATGRSAVARALTASTAAGVPVGMEAGDGVTLTYGSRDTDFSPFNAGGFMYSPSGGDYCSSGFAISINGTTHTTTARHCNHGDYEDANASGDKYGANDGTSGDGAARILGSHGSALAFDGAWNSQNFTKAVYGFGDLSVGDYVCTGGADSGEHCNIKVTNLSVSINDGYSTFSSIEGYQETNGAEAVETGDSGGPVITLDGSTGVWAAGMIQAESKTYVTCGASYLGGQLCSRTVYFTSMRTVVNSISGASLVIA